MEKTMLLDTAGKCLLSYETQQGTLGELFEKFVEDELKKIPEKDQRNFSPELEAVDLSGKDLSGLQFNCWTRLKMSGANLSGAYASPEIGYWFGMPSMPSSNFVNSSLPHSRFWGRDYRESDFRGANLAKSTFEGADVRGCNFGGADLTEVKFDRAKVDETTNFAGAKLSGTRLNKVIGKLKKVYIKEITEEITLFSKQVGTFANQITTFVVIKIDKERISLQLKGNGLDREAKAEIDEERVITNPFPDLNKVKLREKSLGGGYTVIRQEAIITDGRATVAIRSFWDEKSEKNRMVIKIIEPEGAKLRAMIENDRKNKDAVIGKILAGSMAGKVVFFHNNHCPQVGEVVYIDNLEDKGKFIICSEWSK